MDKIPGGFYWIISNGVQLMSLERTIRGMVGLGRDEET
jgi:hypothetical protein